MSDLTEAQEIFLEKHQISSSSIFDATGLKPKVYKATMRKLGKVVAFGVTPCKKFRHRLRNRSGHCVQCNPAAIAFQARHTKTGFVYVAGSQNLRLIKIGFSSNVDNRMDSLNYLNYASTSDWVCLYWISSEVAGKLEYDSQKNLKQFMKPTSYLRDGYSVRCLETFACSAKYAVQTIESIAPAESAFWKNTSQLSEYEFQSEKNKTSSKAKKVKLDSKQKTAPCKAKKQITELAGVDMLKPKIISKPKSPEVSFHGGNAHSSSSLNEGNQAVAEESTVKNQSRFSLFEKIIFYGFLVFLFSVASSSHRISKLFTHNAGVEEANAFKRAGLLREKIEKIQVKTTPPTPLLSKKNSELPVSSPEADRGIDESLRQSIIINPIKEGSLGAGETAEYMGEYIGKNRLALRIDKGPPIKVIEVGDFILWHYRDFKVYIKKSDNTVARVTEEPLIWIR